MAKHSSWFIGPDFFRLSYGQSRRSLIQTKSTIMDTAVEMSSGKILQILSKQAEMEKI